ncbi:TPA: energy coupling factor transporter S component ThiW, partial [Staphylococcus aureus]|nr:energy coupling factor transporter S component ThiW [Staphylococcus aureus]
ISYFLLITLKKRGILQRFIK